MLQTPKVMQEKSQSFDEYVEQWFSLALPLQMNQKMRKLSLHLDKPCS